MEILACPHCERLFRMGSALLGKTIRCRGCREAFHVPVDVASVRSRSADAEVVESTDVLPLAYQCVIGRRDARQCPECSRTFLMKPAFVGKTIRCRGCKASFRVAATEHAAASPAVFDDVGDVVQDPFPEERVPAVVRPRYLPANARDSSSPIAGLLAVALGGICALPVTQMILWWGFAKDPIKLAGAVPHALQWVVPLHMRP